MYDGNAHTISPEVTVPESGYTLKYGASYGGISLDELTYTTAGTHPIYYSVSATDYTTYKGKATLRITKAAFPTNITVTPPTPLTLDYARHNQTLAEAGSCTGYEMAYALGENGENAPTTGWSTTIPQGKQSGSYYVWYKVLGGENYKDSNPAYVVATINEPVWHTVSFTVNNSAMGSLGVRFVIYEFRTDITDTTCLKGDEIELVATPKEGCNFVRWEDNSTDKNRVVTINQDTTITAYFTGFDITANEDPQHAGVYYSTFYHGSVDYALPANVEAYTATVSGDNMLLKKVAVPGDILPAETAVVLRASQEKFTLTPSDATPISVENNALRGTDEDMNVPSNRCYVLSGADGFVGFYTVSSPYTLKAHKAYIDLDNLPGGVTNAPRRMRFVFSEEQTATGMENVQNEETKAQKVMIDGVMYIIRGEHMYDAQGRIVK